MIVRAFPIRDFLNTAVTETGSGTAYDIGSITSTQKLYGALHLTLTSTSRKLVTTIQSATASAFVTPSTEIIFSMTTERGSTWITPASACTTEALFWRARTVLASCGFEGACATWSTVGSWTGLAWIGIQ